MNVAYKIAEFWKTTAAIVASLILIVPAVWYVFGLVASINATATEYKTLKREFHQYRIEQQQRNRTMLDARHVRQRSIDLKLNTLETILKRIDRRVTPRRAQ